MKAKIRHTILTALCVLAGCGARPSNSDLAAKIKAEHPEFVEVVVTEISQEYDDSYRSPSDAGKTYEVRARVTANDQKTQDRSFQVFIAKSDGWVAVREQHGLTR